MSHRVTLIFRNAALFFAALMTVSIVAKFGFGAELDLGAVFQEKAVMLAVVSSIVAWFVASGAVIVKLNRPVWGWSMVVAGISALVFGPMMVRL